MIENLRYDLDWSKKETLTYYLTNSSDKKKNRKHECLVKIFTVKSEELWPASGIKGRGMTNISNLHPLDTTNMYLYSVMVHPIINDISLRHCWLKAHSEHG